MIEDGDIFGDGFNIAARLESLADSAGINVSARVQEDVVGKLDVTFEDLGEQRFKNITRPVRAYRVDSQKLRSVSPLLRHGPRRHRACQSLCYRLKI